MVTKEQCCQIGLKVTRSKYTKDNWPYDHIVTYGKVYEIVDCTNTIYGDQYKQSDYVWIMIDNGCIEGYYHKEFDVYKTQEELEEIVNNLEWR